MKNLILLTIFCLSFTDGYAQLFALSSKDNHHKVSHDHEDYSIDFTIEEKVYGAAIQWQSNTDKVKKFILEKSTNGREFTPLKTIVVDEQQVAEFYTTKDEHMIPGKNYYRLSLENKTGKVYHSKVKQLRYKKNNFFVHVSDNTDVLEIALTKKEKGSIRIFDQQFVLLRSIPLNGDQDTFSVDISEFKDGEYIVQKQNKDSNYMKSFMK